MIKITLSKEQIENIRKNHILDLSKRNDKGLKFLNNVLITLEAEGYKNFARIFKKNNNCYGKGIKECLTVYGKKALGEYVSQVEEAIRKDCEIKDEDITEFKNKIQKYFCDVYTTFSNRKWAREFLEILSCNVCPYCNRVYTFTISKNLKARPEFDHYYPKSEFPYLAISIFNLVPCCSICNKGKSDNFDEAQLYPYEEGFADRGITFSLEAKNIEYLYGNHKEFGVSIKAANLDDEKIVDIYRNSFKLEKLYSMHGDYILEILKKAKIYNECYVIQLLNTYPELLGSKEEVLRIIFGNYLETEDYIKRPLSKLTADILKELNVMH